MMNEPRILQEQSYLEMADIIFEHFTVMQSCKVEDIIIIDGRVIEKGRAVLDRLDLLDKRANTYDGKRKKVKPPNTVGGFVAHKIFKYNRVISNSIIKYTIWRIQ